MSFPTPDFATMNFPTPDFSTPNFPTPIMGLKNPGLEDSWLKSPGLKSPELEYPLRFTSSNEKASKDLNLDGIINFGSLCDREDVDSLSRENMKNLHEIMQSFRFSNVCYWSYLSRTCLEIVLRFINYIFTFCVIAENEIKYSKSGLLKGS